MKRQNPELCCVAKINPYRCWKSTGRAFTGFEKGSFGGPGVGKLSVSISNLVTPKTPSSFLLDECLVKLSLFGGFFHIFMFIPFLREDYPQLTVIFFGLVQPQTFDQFFDVENLVHHPIVFRLFINGWPSASRKCFNWMIRFPIC